MTTTWTGPKVPAEPEHPASEVVEPWAEVEPGWWAPPPPPVRPGMRGRLLITVLVILTVVIALVVFAFATSGSAAGGCGGG